MSQNFLQQFSCVVFIGFFYFVFFVICILFVDFFCECQKLLASMFAYVSTMFYYIDFQRSDEQFYQVIILRVLLSSSSNTRQVHFDHVFHTYVLLHLVSSLQQPSSSDIEFLQLSSMHEVGTHHPVTKPGTLFILMLCYSRRGLV